MTTAHAIELPSYLQLPSGSVCAGCGKLARSEGQPDLQQAERYVCILCTERGITSTPAEVGATAGRAIGRMFFAAQDLLIEMVEAIEQVTDAGPEAAAALAETLAEVQETPIGSWPLLTEQHVDGLGRTMARLWELIARLEPEPGLDPPLRPALSLIRGTTGP